MCLPIYYIFHSNITFILRTKYSISASYLDAPWFTKPDLVILFGRHKWIIDSFHNFQRTMNGVKYIAVMNASVYFWNLQINVWYRAAYSKVYNKIVSMMMMMIPCGIWTGWLDAPKTNTNELNGDWLNILPGYCSA